MRRVVLWRQEGYGRGSIERVVDRGDLGQVNEKAKSSVSLIYVTRREPRGHQTRKGSGVKGSR